MMNEVLQQLAKIKAEIAKLEQELAKKNQDEIQQQIEDSRTTWVNANGLLIPTQYCVSISSDETASSFEPYGEEAKGRRQGKTLSAVQLLVAKANKEPGNYLYLTNYKSQASHAYGYMPSFVSCRLSGLTEDDAPAWASRENKWVDRNGSRIYFCGIDDLDSIRGLKFNCIVKDLA